MGVRGVIFDLDDTLYAETEYVRGALGDVAAALAAAGCGASETIHAVLLRLHAESRDRVIDRAREALGFRPELVPTLVAVHRAHRPMLELDSEVRELLARLRRRYRVACLTDGHAAVQRAKLEALQLSQHLDAIVVADEHGREAWKPSPRGVWIACGLLGVAASETVLVGDNPTRDMQAARAAGARSVRLCGARGYFARCAGPDADMVIERLAEVEAALERLDRSEAAT